MTTVEEAQVALNSAQDATRRARHARDVARDSRILHATIPGYASVVASAEVALIKAQESERVAEADLASTMTADQEGN